MQRKKWLFTLGVVTGLVTGTPAWANPNGANVVHGQVSFSRPNAATLNVTNSPGAIINWQQFSIGVNETTRFIQQSSSSSVLNRVIGQNPSQLLGQLRSNGRVFLINRNGVNLRRPFRGRRGRVDYVNVEHDRSGFSGRALSLRGR